MSAGVAQAADVVIVNWNTGAFLRKCLMALANTVPLALLGSVVVVDNASDDDSLFALPPLPGLRVIRNADNRGFAAGCNEGARQGSAPFIIFCNPDTEVASGGIAAALSYLTDPSHGDVGVCGGVMRNADGSVGISASRFPTLRNVVSSTLHLHRVWPRRFPPRHLPPHDVLRGGRVDQVIGAFFVVRRDCFNELGGFDDRFFVYYEEVDFCRRAALAGIGVVCLPDVEVAHLGGVSARRSGGAALLYSLRSRTLYARKHWSVADTWLLVAFTAAVEVPARLLRALVGSDGASPAEVLATWRSYLRFCWAALRRTPVPASHPTQLKGVS